MKRLLAILCVLFVSVSVYAQEYEYCTITAQVRQLNDRIKKVTIDYGNDSTIVLTKVSLTDACNYVGKQGFELVSSYIKYGDRDVHYLYFKKEIKKEEE